MSDIAVESKQGRYVLTTNIPHSEIEDINTGPRSIPSAKKAAEDVVRAKISDNFRVPPETLLSKLHISCKFKKINSEGIITDIAVEGPAYIVDNLK